MVYPALVIAMGVVMPLLDALFVGLRLYTKRGKTRYGSDDYLIILALVRIGSTDLPVDSRLSSLRSFVDRNVGSGSDLSHRYNHIVLTSYPVPRR